MKRFGKKSLVLAVLAAAFALSLSVGVPTAFAIDEYGNGELFAGRDTPLGVTVTFWDDWDSRGFCWTTTVPTEDPRVQLIASDTTIGVNWQGATTLQAERRVTDDMYYTYQAHATDLAPGKYAYRVGTDGKWSDTGSLTVDDGADGFSFLFTTDPQDYDEVGFSQWATVVEKSFETVPDASFFMGAGDIVNNSHDARDHDMDQWIWVMDLPKEQMRNTVFVPATGNHESWATSFADRYAIDYAGSTQTGGYYAFRYGDALFAVLNTNESASGADAQFSWLEQTLAESDAEWKIVMMHKCPYTTGPAFDDSDVRGWRDRLVPLMAKYKVDLVLQGHDHVYVRTRPYLFDDATGRVPNMAETTITETVDGRSVTYSVEPGGTFYVVGNAAGRKFFQPEAYDRGLVFPATNPYNGLETSAGIDRQMFVSLQIRDNALYYDAYVVDAAGDKSVTLYDSYYLKKDTYVPVEAQIGQLPAASEVGAFDIPAIDAALVAYDALVPRAAAAMSADAADKIASILALPLDDLRAAYGVAALIADAGETEATAEFAKKLKAMRAAYADLTEAQRALVPNADDIDAKEAAMLDLHAAGAVSRMIEQYRAGAVTLDEVRQAYAALTEAQQTLVTGKDGLDLSPSGGGGVSKKGKSCGSALYGAGAWAVAAALLLAAAVAFGRKRYENR